MAFNSGEKTELGEAKHYDQNIKIVSKNYETFFTLHRFVQREVLEVTQFCKDRNLAYFMQWPNLSMHMNVQCTQLKAI